MRHFFLTASHTMCLPMIIAGTAMPATRPIPTGAPTNVPSCQRIFFFRDHGFFPQNVQPDGLQEEKCTFERHVMVPVVQLVEALCYKAEGCGFDSWRCHWHKPSRRTMALRLTQLLVKISTRNISWESSGRCTGLTPLPPSCADCLNIWKAQPPGKLKAWNRPAQGLLYYLHFFNMAASININNKGHCCK